jgi:hypothetical protein
VFGAGDGVYGLGFSEGGVGVEGVSVLKDGVDGFSFTGVGVRGDVRATP